MERLFIDVDAMAQLGGVTPRTVWRDVKRGVCPPPIHSGVATARWAVADAHVWLARRKGLPEPASPPAGLQQGKQPRRPPDEVTVEELSAMIDLSERKIWRLVASGDFPKPMPKPLRPRLWRTADIVAWIDKRMAAGNEPAING